MIRKTIKYTDYDGEEREEDFYFNLSKAELMEMQLTTPGGMEQLINKITKEKDTKRLWEIFKDIICRSYGEKSPDGKRFVKSPELTQAFLQTEAFTELIMELATNADTAAEFMNGIVPQVPQTPETTVPAIK